MNSPPCIAKAESGKSSQDISRNASGSEISRATTENSGFEEAENVSSVPLADTFENELKIHKKQIASLGCMIRNGQKFSIRFANLIESTSKELALVNSDFKCRCGKTNELTIHHIITRDYNRFLDYDKYLTQRNYWANLLVLCADCHIKLHKQINGFELKKENMKFISEELIEKLRKKYVQ